MVDWITSAIMLFVFAIVSINTIFTLRGIGKQNKLLGEIFNTVSKIESSPRRKESEKCPKCKREVDEHTIAEAKKCGILQEK